MPYTLPKIVKGRFGRGQIDSAVLLQGTLDLLALHALRRGPMHGYAIAQTIHLLSHEVPNVEEGSLYPALCRLELDGRSGAYPRTTAQRSITR